VGYYGETKIEPIDLPFDNDTFQKAPANPD
jgi:hypothetical protein